MDFNALVEGYVKARDKKAELKSEYEKKVESLNEWMEKVELTILDHLNSENLESIKTTSGTAFKQHQTSATVADWDSTFAFISANHAWHMLEHRVSKTAVAEYIKEHKNVPPGVNWSDRVVVNVRRA